MRRIFLLAFAASALMLGAPAVASAHHHGKSRHHARRHHKTIVFGSLSGASGTTPHGASPPQPMTPSSGETAGTVKEFTGGVLTILLSDGKTLVSGKVTEQTEIHCQTAAPTEGTDNEQGDNSGGGDSNSGPLAHSSDNTTGNGGDDNGGGDDDHGEQVAGSCTTEALKPGTVVREAELTVGSGGAVWDQIDLIQ